MANEENTSDQVIEEPIIEKSDKELIYEQEDHVESVVTENGEFHSIIYMMVSSITLGKKVIIVPSYIDKIENSQVIGRRAVKWEEITLGIDDEVPYNSLIILDQISAERGI